MDRQTIRPVDTSIDMVAVSRYRRIDLLVDLQIHQQIWQQSLGQQVQQGRQTSRPIDIDWRQIRQNSVGQVVQKDRQTGRPIDTVYVHMYIYVLYINRYGSITVSRSWGIEGQIDQQTHRYTYVYCRQIRQHSLGQTEDMKIEAKTKLDKKSFEKKNFSFKRI